MQDVIEVDAALVSAEGKHVLRAMTPQRIVVDDLEPGLRKAQSHADNVGAGQTFRVKDVEQPVQARDV